jgi:putative addiction module component (TIGR02574 family)
MTKSPEDAAAEPLSVPDWQQRLLDERIAEDEADPKAGSPWEEVKQRILSSLADLP